MIHQRCRAPCLGSEPDARNVVGLPWQVCLVVARQRQQTNVELVFYFRLPMPLQPATRPSGPLRPIIHDTMENLYQVTWWAWHDISGPLGLLVGHGAVWRRGDTARRCDS